LNKSIEQQAHHAYEYVSPDMLVRPNMDWLQRDQELILEPSKIIFDLIFGTIGLRDLLRRPIMQVRELNDLAKG
jgi:hypothetical protein